MSLENTSVVDAVGVDRSSGNVVLTIADGLDWSAEALHLSLLQDKLNAYFGFIESGEILESCPAAQGKAISINVVCRFPLPPSAITLLTEASKVGAALDVKITHQQYAGT